MLSDQERDCKWLISWGNSFETFRYWRDARRKKKELERQGHRVQLLDQYPDQW